MFLIFHPLGSKDEKQGSYNVSAQGPSCDKHACVDQFLALQSCMYELTQIYTQN